MYIPITFQYLWLAKLTECKTNGLLCYKLSNLTITWPVVWSLSLFCTAYSHLGAHYYYYFVHCSDSRVERWPYLGGPPFWTCLHKIADLTTCKPHPLTDSTSRLRVYFLANLQDRDNLSTKDTISSPNVSVIQRFHCEQGRGHAPTQ